MASVLRAMAFILEEEEVSLIKRVLKEGQTRIEREKKRRGLTFLIRVKAQHQFRAYSWHNAVRGDTVGDGHLHTTMWKTRS